MSNPRVEADAILPDGHVARVLEPSPPAVTDDWFADDPPNSPVVAGTVVSPTSSGNITWADLVSDDSSLRDFAADRWLGAYRAIAPAPDGYQETMVALHRLAIGAIAPARYQANTKFGLRWVKGGFGTPFFGDDTQVRVIGSQLHIERSGETESHAISTIDAAAAAIGSQVDPATAAEHDSPEVGATDERLSINADHADYISQWWGMATAALEIVRAQPQTIDPSRPQLWPGHFDIGVEFGDDNTRASYGASPGDHAHDEPYLYVAAWWEDKLRLEGEFFNATAFAGAELSATQLRASGSNPVAAAVEFYTKARDQLANSVKDQ